MKLIVYVILSLILCSSICYASEGNYIRYSISAGQFIPIYDDIYVNESGDTMEGELSMGGFDLHFDPLMFFRRVDENRLDLYIAGNLIHIWELIPAVTPDIELDLENGIALALENGIDLLLE